MANPTDRFDYGLVFVGTTGPLVRFTDVNGQTHDPVLLAAGSEVFMDPAILAAYFHVGGAQRYALELDSTLNGSDTLEVALHGELQQAAAVDATSPLLATFRNDTIATLARHTISSTGKVMLQTANLGCSFTGALGVKLTSNDSAEGTVIKIYLRVER